MTTFFDYSPFPAPFQHPFFFNGHQFTSQEVDLIRLLASEDKNELIAEKLQMRMGTFHLAKKKLYRKLGVETKQGITRIAFALGIISPIENLNYVLTCLGALTAQH